MGENGSNVESMDHTAPGGNEQSIISFDPLHPLQPIHLTAANQESAGRQQPGNKPVTAKYGLATKTHRVLYKKDMFSDKKNAIQKYRWGDQGL